MQKINFSTVATPKAVGVAAPIVPITSRQPAVERKTTDPSSAAPKGQRYPIPAFFEYRIKPREHDPL